MAVWRWAACFHTTLCEPSRTDGRDLLPPVGRQAVQDDHVGLGHIQQGVVDDVARERLAGGSAVSSSCPMLVHTSV